MKVGEIRELMEVVKRIGELNYLTMNALGTLSQEALKDIYETEQLENAEKSVVYNKYCKLNDDGSIVKDEKGMAVLKDGMSTEDAMAEIKAIEDKFKEIKDKQYDVDINVVTGGK